jgi:hypothetical protein
MVDFYKHIHPALTPEQQANYVVLGRHLVMLVAEGELYERAEFDIGETAIDLMTGDWLEPEQLAAHDGPLACGVLGHAVRAGLKALTGETWLAYQERVLGAAFDSPLESWLVSALWLRTDSSADGAAMRLMYVLDYGVPGDWEQILHGQAESDYLSNGFLWDRIGMMRPQKR